MFYPAYIHQDEDGSASGSFPDVPGCYFAGDTLEEAISDASSAIDAHFELLSEKGIEIPTSSGTITNLVNSRNPDYQGGCWYCLMVDLTRYMGKSERINITMPHLLIEKIDKMVGKESRYSSRSHFLAEAARKELSTN